MLIAITGIDGSGKSTQIELLKKFLEKNKYSVAISKAYGKAEEFFLAPFFQYWDSLAITFIFQGLHRQKYISALKEIKNGKMVLADRWDETFLSFHSRFGFLAKHQKLREEWNKLAFESLIPDLTFFLDVPPKVASQRLISRGKNFLDEGDENYQKQIRKSMIKSLAGRPTVFIDGTKSINEIHKTIVSELSKKLKKPKINKN